MRSRGLSESAARAVGLDRLSDGAQNLADLAAEEDQGDDGEDRDKREDECVFGEALTVLEPKDRNLRRTLEPEDRDVRPTEARLAWSNITRSPLGLVRGTPIFSLDDRESCIGWAQWPPYDSPLPLQSLPWDRCACLRGSAGRLAPSERVGPRVDSDTWRPGDAHVVFGLRPGRSSGCGGIGRQLAHEVAIASGPLSSADR